MTAIRVLVVEDDAANRTLAARILAGRGFEPELAEGGAVALQMAAARPPDIVLMDLSMPGMDGWETTRQLRKLPGCDGIPIIALTAHAMSVDVERASAAGCSLVLTKPYRPAQLLDAIAEVLGNPTSGSPAEPAQ